MKLSWLIELIEMNTAPAGGYSERGGIHRWPQCLLMGATAYQDTKVALMQLRDQTPPEKRLDGFSMMINGVPIFLDLDLPDLGILVRRSDGTKYQVEGTYRP